MHVYGVQCEEMFCSSFKWFRLLSCRASGHASKWVGTICAFPLTLLHLVMVDSKGFAYVMQSLRTLRHLGWLQYVPSLLTLLHLLMVDDSGDYDASLPPTCG